MNTDEIPNMHCRPDSEVNAHPTPVLAPCSATCCLCNWTNVNLLNLGEPGAPRWTCHGCCKRMLDTLEKLRDGDFSGTPINRGSSAMMLIEETLSPNAKALRSEETK